MARPTRALLRRASRNPARAARSSRRLPASGVEVGSWELGGGEDGEGNQEQPTAETFGVAGVSSRPTGAPEAVLIRVGGDGHDVIVGTRDHSWAVAVRATGMDAGETWIHTDKAFVRIRANGDIEIGRPDGSFEAVATASHVHAGGALTNSGGPVTGFSGGAIPDPTSGAGIAAKVKAETPGAP